MIHGQRLRGVASDTVRGIQAVAAQLRLAMATLLVGHEPFAVLAGQELLDEVSERIYIADPAFLEVQTIPDVL